MRLAVVADIHDNIWALAHALRAMACADALLVCGDLCSPFTLVQIGENTAARVHVVWGNNDGDKWLLSQQAARFQHVELDGELAEIEIGGLRVAMNHYPEIALGLARSGTYDLVCCGHDHRARVERIGDAVLLNPGEIMGRLGPSTFAWFDTDTRVGQVQEVGRSG